MCANPRVKPIKASWVKMTASQPARVCHVKAVVISIDLSALLPGWPATRSQLLEHLARVASWQLCLFTLEPGPTQCCRQEDGQLTELSRE